MIDRNISSTGGDPQSLDRLGSFQSSISGRLKPEPDEGMITLLTVMSHDIRSSLLSMLATLKLLNRGYYGKMDDEVARKIKGLLSTVTRLTGISEEYVGRCFAMNDEFESGSESLQLVQNIINPVLEELSQELTDRRIKVGNRDPFFASKTYLKGDKIWLKTIFRNLIRNAIKHSPKGCTIAIGFEDRGSYCRLNVYNDGDPIPEHRRDRLFTKFGRIENPAEKNGKDAGLGLGLYLIKKIIERQGGEIWYEAEEHGSNFVFTLPAGCESRK